MSFTRFLTATLGPAALVGLAAGVFLGGHDVGAGFPFLAVDALRRALFWTLVGALVLAALFALLRRLLPARLGAAPRSAVAVAIAAAPFVALAGYHLNRSRAIKPSELLEPWALGPNLLLVAACAAAAAVAGALLHAWSQGRLRPPRWTAIAAVVLLALLQAAVWWGFRGGVKRRPDVLVLLVDALRADELGCYGYGRETSPAIDALARDSVLFRQAISASTFTKTSIASLFTGRYPYRHGLYWGSRQLGETVTADLLGEEETTLAERLQDAGYLTAAWVQNSHLRRVMGFAQGFVEYHDQQGAIERIHRRFFPWLAGPGRRYPFFAYLHYIDLHDPYRPPPPYDTLFGGTGEVYDGIDLDEWGAWLEAVRRGDVQLADAQVADLRALYDGQLRRVDDEVGRLLDRLRRLGLYDDALIVLTADHGDAFMEHGFVSHSATPYDELVRVPLLVKLPANRHAGLVVADQVRLVDLLPTVLAAAGVARPAAAGNDEVDGCNLLPWIAAGGRPADADPRCSWAVTEIAEEDEGEPTLAVRSERFKVIRRARGEEVYDLAADPGEHRNLAAEPPPEVEPLRALADELLRQRAAARESLELDEKTIRELKALGYIGD